MTSQMCWLYRPFFGASLTLPVSLPSTTMYHRIPPRNQVTQLVPGPGNEAGFQSLQLHHPEMMFHLIVAQINSNINLWLSLLVAHVQYYNVLHSWWFNNFILHTELHTELLSFDVGSGWFWIVDGNPIHLGIHDLPRSCHQASLLHPVRYWSWEGPGD